jgi:hypothetical protein
MKNDHTWKKTARGFGKRFAVGTALSLSLTLVAFEWSITRNHNIILGPITMVDPIFDDVPRVTIRKEVEKIVKEEKPKPRNTSGTVKAVDEPIELVAIEIPIDEGTTDEGTAGTEEEKGSDTEAKYTMPPPTLNPAVLPHFIDCDRGDMEKTNKCTEARILRHLERHLKIPKSVRGMVATTVTFEVDSEGNIGRLHCAPKVSSEVEKEIDRVIRSLPEFEPGRQGGHPVPVYYQIPLRLRTN